MQGDLKVDWQWQLQNEEFKNQHVKIIYELQSDLPAAKQ